MFAGRATPSLSTLSVELVAEHADHEEPRIPTRFAEPASLVRQRTLAAVQRHGGHVAGQRLSRREKCRRHLNSLGWQSGQLLACLADIIMLFAEMNGASVHSTNTVTFFVLLIFVVDLALRVYTFRQMLLRRPWAYFDFIVVGLSVIIFFVGVANEAELGVETSDDDVQKFGTGLRGLLVFMRWLRAIRATAMLCKTGSSGRSAARQLTGENKRRFIDLDAGFDLDLAYIHPRLIAMSVPATGVAALYRNPLAEVVRFFEVRHAKEGVLIVNACPEMPYPHERFHALGRVVAFEIQDHTPPSMAQFVDFLNQVAAAWREGRVVVVHCRGGKGRTGSLVCAWLLFVRVCVDADDALAKFALERTELALGKKKLQGVDTPSQRRYVHQVHSLLQAQGAYYDAAAPQRSIVCPPPRPPFVVRELVLRGFFAAPPPGPLVCAIHTEAAMPAGAERAEGGVASRRPGPCFVTFWSAPVELSAASPPEIVRFHLDATAVAGDVRVSVFSLPALLRERARRLQRGLSGRLPFDRAPAPPWRDVEEGAGGGGGGGASHLESLDDERVRAGDEPGCLFYFIFHTAYAKLEMSRLSFGAGADGGGPSEMRVPVRMMDKAFKSVGMRKSKYRDDGEATLTLSRPADVGVAPPLAHEAAPPHPHAPAAACNSCGEGAAACSAAVPSAPLQQPAPAVDPFVTVPLVATQSAPADQTPAPRA